MVLFKNEQVTLPLVAAEKSSRIRHPGFQTAVNLRHDTRPLFHQALIVVQKQHRRHRAAVLIHVPRQSQFRHVHPVGGSQKTAAPPVGAHQMAEHQKTPACVAHLLRALAFSLQQPVGVEARNQGGQLGVVKMLPLVGQAQKPVVCPDNVVAFRAEEYHWQRGVDHGVFGGGVHGACIVIQIPVYLPPSPAGALPAVQAQTGHNAQLHQGQLPGKSGGQRRKQNQADKIQPKTWLKQII